jgi:hypothetical protein
MRKTLLGPLLAAVACLALYWPGLTAWFHQDDFAWLGLGWQVQHGMPLARALFAPMTEGTVRVLSERGFFVLFYGLFGLHALPFRLAVFATQIASLFLLASVTRRLTDSRAAAGVACFLWITNSALATPLSWTSAYNQILCAFFALAGLWFLFRYLDTGRHTYYAAEWIVLLLGFGASEFMIVYPAAAALLVVVHYRRLPRSVLALFLPSVVFALYHFVVLKPPTAGPYAMHFDARILSTLATYWRWSLGPGQLEWFERMSAPAAGWLSLAITIPLLAFVLLRGWGRDLLPAALLGWYLFWLTPIIALPNHIIEYYPAIGSIGLAILGGWALLLAWRSHKAWFALTAVALLTYTATSATASRIGSSWHYEQGRLAKLLFRGVAQVRTSYPGRTILLSGVDEQLFWSAVFDNPFRLLGGPTVYLTPVTPDYASHRPEVAASARRYRLSGPAPNAVVYDVRTGDIVPSGLEDEHGDPSRTVALGDDSSTSQLGEGWYQPEGSHRWMSRRASFTIARPRTSSGTLRVEGYAPAFLLAKGAVRLSVAAEGHALGTREVREPDAPFALDFPLPPVLVGPGLMRVTLEVNRTTQLPGDRRPLGLALTRLEETR